MADSGDIARSTLLLLTLLLLTLLGVAACALTWGEVRLARSSANTVLKRGKRAYDYCERFYPRLKSPLEVKKEQCENYWPCEQLSERVGFYFAYQRYFGAV